MCGETCGVDRRRGHDQLEIAAFGQQALEVTEQEIDIEAAFVSLIKNDRVVAAKPGITLGFGEQDAIGHELDQGRFTDLLGKAHLESNQITDRCIQLAGDAARNRARGNAAWLGTSDHSRRAASGGQAKLRQLGGLARTGFTGKNDDLMLADQLDDFLTASGDRQRFINADHRHAYRPCSNFRRRCLDLCSQPRDLLGID